MLNDYIDYCKQSFRSCRHNRVVRLVNDLKASTLKTVLIIVNDRIDNGKKSC